MGCGPRILNRRQRRGARPVGRRVCRPRPSFHDAESALTLIELLIVLFILVLLVGVTIPVLSPPGDERRLREASRGVNTFLAGAQARAVQSGRPAGVLLKRLGEATGDAEDNAACVELYAVREPPPYAGLEESSRVLVSRVGAAGGPVVVEYIAALPQSGRTPGLPAGWRADLVPPGVLQPGDVIEFGGAGYTLEAAQGPAAGNCPVVDGFFDPTSVGVGAVVRMRARPVDPSVRPPPPAIDADGDRLSEPQPPATPAVTGRFRSDPLRYRVRRLPAVTSAPPYQLPEGTAIDLRASGTDALALHRDEDPLQDKINNALPVVLMFAPDGSVSRLYAGADVPASDGVNNGDVTVASAPEGGVYLLVGARENIPAPIDPSEADLAPSAGTRAELEAAKARFNWLNGDARWVVVNAATGSVTTSPNGFVDVQAVASDFAALSLPDRRDLEIRLARDFALGRVKEGGQ